MEKNQSSCSRARLLGCAIVVGAVLVTSGCSGGATTGGALATSTGPPSTATTAPLPSSEPPTSSPTLPSGIRVGPGPQATYTVQPQPAPGSCHYGYSGPYPLPDRQCTPGAINPHVTQADISSTICSAGYEASVRPPESVTEPEKVASSDAYGYMGSLRTAEYDHLIPLELGGDPNDPANLWVEPNDRAGATTTSNTKDSLENALHDLVCSGRMTLAAARQAIATDWVAAYQQHGWGAA